ncbi:MAG: hypothetical protein HYV41_04390 [Candidatus Magasanikbacteria bacterium]|nr:hypothetical protein [Candidatus Magasanikbacteria bacterium]
MHKYEIRVSQHIDTEGVEITRKMQEAKNALKELAEGYEFLLPTDKKVHGSLIFWKEICKGLHELYGEGTQAVEAVNNIITIFDNGGAVRESTLIQVKDAINQTATEHRDLQQMAA